MIAAVPSKHLHQRAIAVHTLCWLLVAVALFDGGGLAFGDKSVTTSASYEALREIPGGMRTWGVILLGGAAAISWGIGEDSAGHPRALNRVLAVGVFYYGTWTIVIPLTWLHIHHIPAWGGPSKTALLAVLYFICARAVAPPKPPPGKARASAA